MNTNVAHDLRDFLKSENLRRAPAHAVTKPDLAGLSSNLLHTPEETSVHKKALIAHDSFVSALVRAGQTLGPAPAANGARDDASEDFADDLSRALFG